jgi:hypothetical protein
VKAPGDVDSLLVGTAVLLAEEVELVILPVTDVVALLLGEDMVEVGMVVVDDEEVKKGAALLESSDSLAALTSESGQPPLHGLTLQHPRNGGLEPVQVYHKAELSAQLSGGMELYLAASKLAA